MASWQTTTASLLSRLTVKQLLQRDVSVEKLRGQIGAIERLFPAHPPGFEVAHDHSLPNCKQRLAQLARVAGLSGHGQSDDALAAAFVARVRQLNSLLSIPRSVEALRKEDFERIVDNAFAEAHGTYGVPRYLDRSDALELLIRLLPS